ncbi:delta-aminolevulinic acid dehydratase [Kroppenstedtia pulmonis]|uniref:Delta-aminolevulinic acid dehydratase n=1 Tax=Kroppenstedtia pulmonis TaxID=1380685 RepID=A0A7D3XK69_9BACL|nr:CHAT domain-containing protein [Kroppenstedtia pulmonis]QKG85279.1 delta-aminolevulinic acid dehydratase [Kroppenstedtia pulmonis]
MKVALIVGDTGNEAHAIRYTLEDFGAEVMTKWIGRPNAFLTALTKEGLYPGFDTLVLSFHGDDGFFLMPELGEEVYEEGEPRGDIGPKEIRQFASLEGKTVLSTGCETGKSKLAQAFLDAGCKAYIAPEEAVDGNATVIFTQLFFYEKIQNNRRTEEAFRLAQGIDSETGYFRLFQKKE